MSELNPEQLDVLARELGKLPFSWDGSNRNEFMFVAERKNHSLVLKHDNIEVTISGFKLVDFDKWRDRQYPAVENRVIQYLYQAEVNAKVGNTEVKDAIALGYWRDREKLLAPLGRTTERDILDTLLLKIDRVAGAIFPIELAGGAQHSEDARSKIKEF